jgi:hypothetical protein
MGWFDARVLNPGLSPHFVAIAHPMPSHPTPMTSHDIPGYTPGMGLYFVSALLHGELHHISLTTVQYFFMLPTFVCVLPIYSFCNLVRVLGGSGRDMQSVLVLCVGQCSQCDG